MGGGAGDLEQLNCAIIIVQVQNRVRMHNQASGLKLIYI